MRRPEGPFGDHYGYYSLQHDYPVFNVKQIAGRRDAMFGYCRGQTATGRFLHRRPAAGSALAALPGRHAGRAATCGRTAKRDITRFAVRWSNSGIRAKRWRVRSHPRWGRLSLTKFLLVTDRTVDLEGLRATLEHVLARTNPRPTSTSSQNLSMDTLDYSGPEVNKGLQGRGSDLAPVRDLQRSFSASELPQGIDDVRVFCGGCLVVKAPGLSGRSEHCLAWLPIRHLPAGSSSC